MEGAVLNVTKLELSDSSQLTGNGIVNIQGDSLITSSNNAYNKQTSFIVEFLVR